MMVRPGPSGPGYYSYNLGNWHIVSLNSDTFGVLELPLS